MSRFFVDSDFLPGAILPLPKEQARHAIRALRLAVGDSLELANGRGQLAEGRVRSVAGGLVMAEILSVREEKARHPRVEVVQAQLKGPKMDWLVEKLTELGVDAIRVVQTEFTVAGAEKKDRWQRLAEAAMKQSGAPRMPEISGPDPLEKALGEISAKDFALLLDPASAQPLAGAVLKRPESGRVLLFIGPEGGFSPAESAALARVGCRPVCLSRQVLRGETAGIVAAAIVTHLIDF